MAKKVNKAATARAKAGINKAIGREVGSTKSKTSNPKYNARQSEKGARTIVKDFRKAGASGLNRASAESAAMSSGKSG